MKKRNLKKETDGDIYKMILKDENALEQLKKSFEDLTSFAYAHPNPMWSGIFDNNEESKKLIDLTLSTIYKVLDDEKKGDKILDKILSEVIIGAYQDRMVAYTISPSGVNKDSTETLELIQKLRQKADLHLIRVIQEFKNIKRPSVQVIVKQADQVNVGEKQMNVDKQVNISSDLDKK